MHDYCEIWVVRLTFRCTHKPSSNGIEERYHRTIKRMSSAVSGLENSVFWFNVIPVIYREFCFLVQCYSTLWSENNSFTQSYFHFWKEALEWKLLMTMSVDNHVGNEVWVKPLGARCTSSWKPGVVTEVKSKWNVEIDRVPWHVCNIRRRLANNCNKREKKDVVSEPLPLNNPNFTMKALSPLKMVLAQAITVRLCMLGAWRKKDNYRRVNDVFCELWFEHHGECDYELEYCSVYIYV